MINIKSNSLANEFIFDFSSMNITEMLTLDYLFSTAIKMEDTGSNLEEMLGEIAKLHPNMN